MLVRQPNMVVGVDTTLYVWSDDQSVRFFISADPINIEIELSFVSVLIRILHHSDIQTKDSPVTHGAVLGLINRTKLPAHRRLRLTVQKGNKRVR